MAASIPRVVVSILIGVTIGAALTVVIMAMTDSPAADRRLTSQHSRRGTQNAQSSKQPRSALQMIMNQPRHQNWITIAEPADPNAEGFNNTAISSAWKGQRGSPVPQTAEGRAYNGLQAAPLKPDDIVLAMTTSKAHEHLALETRLSRKDRRTYIATNYTWPLERQEAAAQHNEMWEYYPDDWPLRSRYQSDSRLALTPFLAHRRFGDTYKWLLYGDDDTFFFDHALISTLQEMDPDMPYFLTDHMWWQEYLDGHPERIKPGSIHHPHEKAPVCVPCHYTKNTSDLPFPSPPGCPCTPEILCNADVGQEFLAKSGPRGACGMPRVPIRSFSMHGGAGAVLSIGLMRAISLEWFEDCVHNAYSTGGDAIISMCLWEAGFGMTSIDPFWHPRKQNMFDVGRIAQGEDDNIRKRLAVVLRTHLQKAAGLCLSDACQLEWNHTVSLHMRSRMFPSRTAHAELSRVFTALADMALGQLNPFEQHSLDVTMQMTNEKVLAGLQRLRKAEASNTQVMDKASIAAADAVAHAILDAIWEHADASPPPPIHLSQPK